MKFERGKHKNIFLAKLLWSSNRKLKADTELHILSFQKVEIFTMIWCSNKRWFAMDMLATDIWFAMDMFATNNARAQGHIQCNELIFVWNRANSYRPLDANRMVQIHYIINGDSTR